jgi:hypothetical protein
MVWHRNCNCRIGGSFLHYDVTAALSDFKETMLGEDGANFFA